MASPEGLALLERLLHAMAEGPVRNMSSLAGELDVSERGLPAGREPRPPALGMGLAADSARKMGGGEGDLMIGCY